MVIISFAFLENRAFKDSLASHRVVNELTSYSIQTQLRDSGVFDSYDAFNQTLPRESKLITAAMELKRTRNVLKMNSPTLDMIKWWRVVVDEGHEILGENQLRSHSW